MSESPCKAPSPSPLRAEITPTPTSSEETKLTNDSFDDKLRDVRFLDAGTGWSSPEESDTNSCDDELDKLIRICNSDRFRITEGPLRGEKCSKSKKKRRRKKKNKFVIFSSSEHFDEFCDAEEDFQWPDPSSTDPEDANFFKAWEEHWSSKGEEILWKTWNEKYSDYINKDFNLLEHLKSIPIVSSSSDSEEDDEMNVNRKKENIFMMGRRQGRATATVTSDDQGEEISEQLWDDVFSRPASLKKEDPKPEDENKELHDFYNVTCRTKNSNKTGEAVEMFHRPPLVPNTFEEEDDKVKKNENIRKTVGGRGQRRKRTTSFDDKAEEVPEKLWNEAWDKHVNEEYTREYCHFYTISCRVKKRKTGEEKDNEEKDETVQEKKKKQPSIDKYFRQRYSLFSKYDDGIQLDNESWFSVTPENIAEHIANRFAEKGFTGLILDPFSGCGGNVIQFAKVCEKVIALDIDPVKVENCKHNAKIYGVEKKIEFINGDFMEFAPILRADAIFLSPPWGGPSYQNHSVFDIDTMIPMNGTTLFKVAQQISPNIAYLLPRNVNVEQVEKLAGHGNFVEIEKNYANGRVKTITAYFGGLAKTSQPEEKETDTQT